MNYIGAGILILVAFGLGCFVGMCVAFDSLDDFNDDDEIDYLSEWEDD